MSKSTFYFDHDYNARNDQKILELRAQYGWQGYGIYFALVETLCESKNEIKREALAGLSLGLSLAKAELISMLDFMIKLGLFQEQNGIISSKRVNEHLLFRSALSQAGRKGGRPSKKARLLPGLSQAKANKGNNIIINIDKDNNDVSRFVKPSVEQIAEYCRERKNNIDAQHFFDHYESKGWKIGKNPMKNWKAAVRTWEKNSFNPSTPQSNPQQQRPIMHH